MTDTDPERGDFLNAVLYPHRSLTRSGFNWVMGIMAVSALGLAVLFWSLGAWPIVAFLALDVVIVWVAFRINFDRARQHEKLRLTQHNLIVEKSAPGKRTRRWAFCPGRASVTLLEAGEHHASLQISGTDHSLEIGAFLSPQERAEAAAMLKSALAQWRSPHGHDG